MRSFYVNTKTSYHHDNLCFVHAVLFSITDDFLQNVRVTIGESEDNVSGMKQRYLCGYIPGQPPGDVFTVTCTERMYGRFVRVMAVEINNLMSLRELEVYGW